MKEARYDIEDEHEGHKFTWKLTMAPSSKPSVPNVTCPECGGACRRTFGMIDDPVNCWRCSNTGQVAGTSTWDPPPPPELVEAIRKVWKDYWNKQQNDKFTLTMQ